MDVPTVIRKAGRRFGDSANVLIEEADFLDFINDAQLTIARETGVLEATVTSAAGSTFPLTIPTDLLEIKRVTYDGRPIPKVEVESLDSLGLSVDNYANGPEFFYTDDNKINLFPDANDNDTTNITVVYSKTPTVITTTAGALTVPLSFHEDVVTFVVMRCHEVNQNYRAQEIAYNTFMAAIGNRVEETTVKDDTYPVIRDDPMDIIYYD